MIKIAIVDDERYIGDMIRKEVIDYAGKRKQIIHVRIFQSGEEILQCSEQFEVIFLDIKMDGISGIDTAKKLRQNRFEGRLIFITALEEYVFDSFDVRAFGYLLKPLEQERFIRTMDRVMEHLENEKERNLVVFCKNEYKVISYLNIVYCESENRKISVHTLDEKVITYYCKIEDLEKELGQDFYRCHRSYLINLRHVRGYNEDCAYLGEGQKVPVSRLRRREFATVILQYMKGRAGGV